MALTIIAVALIFIACLAAGIVIARQTRADAKSFQYDANLKAQLDELKAKYDEIAAFNRVRSRGW